MKFLISALFLLFSFQSFAQCSASDCPCFMKTGDRYIQKKDYKKAIFNYLVARDCDPKLGPTIEKKLASVFSTIEQQRVDAIKAKEEVESEQQKTKTLLNELKEEQKKTAAALNKSQEEEQKNKKIINAFYFYEGKYALAYKNGYYGFINQQGDVLIDYQYEEAEPFNKHTGFAKVKKDKNSLLIDSSGKEYPLAENIYKLNKKTKALDLSYQNLEKFPSEILDNPQLEILLLHSNYLTHIPKEIGTLTQLSWISLGDNELLSIPAEIGELTKLSTLWLTYNKLQALPNNMKNLNKLTKLVLANNNFTTLPSVVKELESLNVFSFTGWGIKTISKDMLDLIEEKKIKVAYFSKNQLRYLPNRFFSFKHLTKAFLIDNPIPKEKRSEIEQKMPWCTFVWE